MADDPLNSDAGRHADALGAPFSDREIFDRVIEMPPAARDAALDVLLGDEPERRARIARLIAAEEASARASTFLDRAFLAALSEAAAEPEAFGSLPRPLGPFRLLRVLGAGGMGVVFEAEQERPRRLVALKVMRADLASRDAIVRFRREIEMLGRLQHPGIAQIHDAGSIDERDGTGASIPYIAMELVRGVPLDDFVRRRASGTREIVELVATVTDAVHHAHQRGVVHRDLKPANILVALDDGGAPRPTVLDFGIARLASREGRGPTLATSAGQILGTIAYMSPEQIAGDPAQIDARTDVYALGTMLYELLAGRLPLDVRDRPIADAARIVRDEEPTRLGAVEPRCKGDLETIVAKAIEKDPARRYPTAQALGDELRRWLRDEPILARPTTRIERVRRFARRHRAIVVGTLATMFALVAGTIASAVFATRAIESRDRAERMAYRASIAAANAAATGHDVVGARRFLDDAPPRFRGWEWRLLEANLDRSAGVLELEGTPRFGRSEIVGTPLFARAIAAFLGTSTQPRPDEWTLPWPSIPARNEGDVLLDVDATGATSLWRSGPKTVVLRTADGGEHAIALDEPPIEGLSVGHIGRLGPDGRSFAVLADEPTSSRKWIRYVRLDGGPSGWLQALNNGRHIAIAVGPNDVVAATGGPDRLPSLWNVATGARIPLPGHRGDANTVDVDPTGTLVATGGADRSVRLWSATTGASLAIATEHLDQVTCVRFDAAGTRLASGSYDRTVRVWSVPRLDDSVALTGHLGGLQMVEFDADGRWLHSLDDERTVRRWPADAERATGTFSMPDSAWGSLVFAARAPVLAAVSSTGVVRVWDLADACDGIDPPVVALPRAARLLEEIAIAPDGRALILLDTDRKPTVVRRTDDGWIADPPIDVRLTTIAFTEDGRPVGVRAPDELMARPGLGVDQFLTLEDLRPLSLPLPRLFGPRLFSNADASLVAYVEYLNPQGIGFVFDAATGAQRMSARLGYGAGFALTRRPDGTTIVALVEAELEGGDRVNTITIRDATTGALLRTLEGHTAHVFTLAFTPDGTRLASAGRDRLVRVWDTATWEETAAFSGPTSFVWSIAFAGDGSALASSSGDRAYRIWRLASRSGGTHAAE
jgi:serine/threonine protein kinase/WD40 repeat protein